MINNLYCFHPLSLWQFVTAAVGNEYTHLYLSYISGFHLRCQLREDFEGSKCLQATVTVGPRGSFQFETTMTESLISKENSGDKEHGCSKSTWGLTHPLCHILLHCQACCAQVWPSSPLQAANPAGCGGNLLLFQDALPGRTM